MFPPHRSGCVRSAKPTVTKTCLQCGAVLPSSVRACNFCDSILFGRSPSYEDERAFSGPKKTAVSSPQDNYASTKSPSVEEQGAAWRGELGQRVEAYRGRHGKAMGEDFLRSDKLGRGVAAPLQRNARGNGEGAQSRLPFGDPADERRSVGVVEPAVAGDEEFSFTIAIGRYSSPDDKREGRMVIDVSLPPGRNRKKTRISKTDAPNTTAFTRLPRWRPPHRGADRCRFLLFAFGGFLALFSSLGGQFTLSKLTAAVYVATFAIVYLQYFALFTVFGGTTPGMMFRGLQVASFSGAPPSPRQLLLRSIGYVLSASAFFTGFLWAWWDEDGLTWHDRISRTYLSSPATRAHMHTPSVAQGH